MRRPAPISSTTASAISPTISSDRAEALSRPPVAPRLTSLFSADLQIATARLKKGHKPEHESDRQGKRDDDREHARIDGDICKSRNVWRRCDQQHAKRDRRQDDAQHGRYQHQHGVFDDELPDQPSDSGSERLSDRDLARTDDAARQQQMRDVDARNQQHDADGCEQHEEGRLARAENHIAQRLNEDAAGFIDRVRLLQVGGNGAQFLLRGLEARSCG